MTLAIWAHTNSSNVEAWLCCIEELGLVPELRAAD